MAEQSPPWPGFFTKPEALAHWLSEQAQLHQGDKQVQRHLLTLRWLVMAELDRTAPEPPAKPALPIGQR